MKRIVAAILTSMSQLWSYEVLTYLLVAVVNYINISDKYSNWYLSVTGGGFKLKFILYTLGCFLSSVLVSVGAWVNC